MAQARERQSPFRNADSRGGFQRAGFSIIEENSQK
jgi:hypothetical protein